MDINRLPPGKNPPYEVNVFIEVPLRSDPIKYEFDKETGFIFVDRLSVHDDVLPVQLRLHPQHTERRRRPDRRDGGRAHAGDVRRGAAHPPHRRPEDGGRSRHGREAAGGPDRQDHAHHKDIRTYTDLPQIDLARIAHFFEHYKDLEPNKWVKIQGWEGPEMAHQVIIEGIERAKGKLKPTGE